MSTSPLQLQSIDEALALTGGTFTRLPKIAVPFTTIVNRAQCVDPANDHQPRFGISRFMTQQIQEVQGESGPNGERVWKPINDQMDQVRFVGAWTSNNSSSGQFVYSPGTNTTDYIEITFFGTGLNILSNDGNEDLRATIDGGSEGSNFFVNQSSVIYARNYSSNSIIPAVSGLTLGTHTVKIRVSSASDVLFFGFEVLNTATTLQLVPGSSYVGGRKVTKSALSTDSYNSNFESGSLGTKGGHVVVYQKPDGTIKKAVNPADATALYLTSATHTNESVIRSLSFREFGAGRADDFSLLTPASNIGAAFTLDDGTTTLVSSSAQTMTAGGLDALLIVTVSGTITITFTGTGLDILRADNGSGTETYTVVIDGVSQGNLNTTGSTTARVEKICSGLPYGSHTVMFTKTSGAFYAVGFCKFIVYGTSKPAVPTGSVELADYYVMGNYVANATAGATPIAQGVLRKYGTREFVYAGSGWSIAPDFADMSGLVATTSATGDAWTYVFFGTGFEHRWFQGGGAVTPNATYTVDGSSNLSAFTTSIYANGLTFTASTGTIGGTGSGTVQGAGIQVSGLSLGFHKVTFTRNAGNTNTFTNDAFDIITPIHSPKSNLPGDLQNTLLVGSNSLGDSRLLPAQTVKPLSNWAQAVGVTTNPTTTSTSFVPIPDMTCIIKTTGNPIEVSFNMTMFMSSVTSADSFTQIFVDGVAVGVRMASQPSAGNDFQISHNLIVPVAAGHHIVQAFWFQNSAVTLTASGTARLLKAREIT